MGINKLVGVVGLRFISLSFVAMNIKTSSILFSLLLFFVGTLLGAVDRPNLLIILSDDQGHGDVGAYGCRDFATPNIDTIAQHGVRCTAGYTTAPQCAPSRCGLITGRYQQRFGYEFNNDLPGAGLPLGEKTLADRLRSNGYVTGAIGKWHLGSTEPFHPMNRGFSEFFGFLGGGHAYMPPVQRPSGQRERSALMRNRSPVQHTKYLTDQFGEEAVSFIERHASQPWFLYLAFNAPHSPLQATDAYLARVASIVDKTRRTYAAMVTAMDDNVGRVLDCLRATGQESRTLIVFLSDNGGPLGKAWNGSSNAPFSGQKGDTLEGGIRVPFLIQWKGVLPEGKSFDQPVISVDLAPTMLAAARIGDAATNAFDGVNLLPALKGELPLQPRILYWRFNFPPGRPTLYKSAIRAGNWKYVKNWDRTSDGKQVEGKPRLINLEHDVAEASDLSSIERVHAERMKADWDAWNRTLPEPFWGQYTAGEAKRKKRQPEQE